MSEKRDEFLKNLKQNQGETNNEAQESDRIFAIMDRSAETRRNFAKAQKENDEAKKSLREEIKVEGIDQSNAIFAAMNNSGRLREKLAKAEADVEASKRDIR